ncbi:MAG TPA: substrate-binding domain-containing protein [Gemmata sp.]|nr:substrate-binding domain-containing protein [Gemmata sp.]
MGLYKSKPPRVASSVSRMIRSSVPALSPLPTKQTDGPRHSPRVKQIALSFPLRLGPWQEIVRGVYRYAEGNKSWVIAFHAEEDVSVALAGKPDGVIAMVQSADAAHKLRAWGGPVVVTASDLDDLPFVQIGFDPLATGKMAAEHLMLLRGRAYAFVGNPSRLAGRLMRQGFVERLNRAGFEAILAPSCFDRPFEPAEAGERTMIAWLATLPHPVAVFVCHDLLAHRLAGACLAAGLRVPQDIAILGCLNDEFLCNVSQPPLSSVSVPLPAVGYEAAKILDAIVASIPVPPRIEFPPLGVVARQSTDPAALAEPALAAALRFIRDNVPKRIGVEDIAAASGLSRSSLERRFRAVVGRSPLAELLRERVDRAQHLLAETDLTMKEVALATGFHDVRHLSVTFRQKAGVTPGKFRARFRPY